MGEPSVVFSEGSHSWFFTAYAKGILLCNQQQQSSNTVDGVLLIKLFNLLIKEFDPRCLQEGILVSPDDLRTILRSPTSIQWDDCHKAELNSREVEIETLAAMAWDPVKGLIRLEVTFE